jgi:hypothetical protein
MGVAILSTNEQTATPGGKALVSFCSNHLVTQYAMAIQFVLSLEAPVLVKMAELLELQCRMAWLKRI